MHSNDIKDKFIALRAKGVSFRTIGERLNISKSVASNWAAEFKTEIDNHRAFELEAIQEAYLITFEAEMALLGDEFKRVMAELRGRDYGYESTAALWNQLSVLLARMDKKRVYPNPIKTDENKPTQPETSPQT